MRRRIYREPAPIITDSEPLGRKFQTTGRQFILGKLNVQLGQNKMI